MRFLRRHAMLIILFCFFGASTWLIISTQKTLKKQPKHIPAIDAYLKNADYKRYDPNGLLALILHAPLITLEKSKHQLLAKKPILFLPQPHQPSWKITANILTTNTTTNVLHFKGHVVLYQPGKEPADSTTITTNTLTIYPGSKAITNEKVMATSGNGSFVEGVGARINLIDGSLTLLSHTHALLIPQKQSDNT